MGSIWQLHTRRAHSQLEKDIPIVSTVEICALLQTFGELATLGDQMVIRAQPRFLSIHTYTSSWRNDVEWKQMRLTGMKIDEALVTKKVETSIIDPKLDYHRRSSMSTVCSELPQRETNYYSHPKSVEKSYNQMKLPISKCCIPSAFLRIKQQTPPACLQPKTQNLKPQPQNSQKAQCRCAHWQDLIGGKEKDVQMKKGNDSWARSLISSGDMLDTFLGLLFNKLRWKLGCKSWRRERRKGPTPWLSSKEWMKEGW